MQNYLRIKLDPQRGGSSAFDFLQPLFAIRNWPSPDIDIWTSPDNISWTRLQDTDFAACYDPTLKILYLSFLADLTSDIWIAFFNIGGVHSGIAYTLEKFDLLQIGWLVEASDISITPIAWTTGSPLSSDASVGCSIYGHRADNIPLGFDSKYPVMVNFLIGNNIAAATDLLVRAGYSSGLLTTNSCAIAATILGLSELPLDLIAIDPATLASMSAEVSILKQKDIILTGTSPEELD
jgi:hypothetical protein